MNDGAPGKFRVQGQINIDPGTGPRHIAIRDGILFTVHETASTLTAQQIPGAPNGTTFPLIANVSIVPPESSNFNGSFFGAEILISEPTDRFPDPLIYVSNRNLGPDFDPRGDSIAIFEFQNSTVAAATADTSSVQRHRFHARDFQERQDITIVNSVVGSLVLQAQVFTGLRQIRSMALGNVADGGDEFLIAGANLDGGVAVLQRINRGRNLTVVARNEEIANRTSFVFL